MNAHYRHLSKAARPLGFVGESGARLGGAVLTRPEHLVVRVVAGCAFAAALFTVIGAAIELALVL